MEYDCIIHYRLHNISDTLFGAKVVELTEDKDKRIMELELKIRRLYMIIQLQDDIIESYNELAKINRGKVVIG